VRKAGLLRKSSSHSPDVELRAFVYSQMFGFLFWSTIQDDIQDSRLHDSKSRVWVLIIDEVGSPKLHSEERCQRAVLNQK
jgi:hypothetical protein